jgi:DNA-binding MarR family transcriptional regulator
MGGKAGCHGVGQQGEEELNHGSCNLQLNKYIVMRYMSNSDKPEKPRPAIELRKVDYEALAAFRYSLRKFLHFSEAAAQEKGLSAPQHQALLAIEGFPARNEITVGELAEQLQIKHHSAVGLVDRLAEQGLLRRLPSREDRRQVFLKVTVKGLRLLRQLSLAHRRELQQLTPQLKSLCQNRGFPS